MNRRSTDPASFPFKAVRPLCVPLAALSGACCLRSVLPSVAPSSNRQPFLSVAFHHLSGANLAAPSGTNLLLLVPVSTDYFAPHHYPAAHTDQPIELAPLQAHSSALRSPRSAPRRLLSPLRAFFAVPGNHQPFSAVRTLRHEPLPPSFSLRSSRPSPNQWPRQLPSAGHRPRPTFPLMRVARPAPPRFSTSAPDPSSSVSRSLSAQLFATVHDPHSLSCASPDLRRLTFPIPAPNTSSSVPRSPRLKSSLSSSSVPRVHGSTFRRPLDVRPSASLSLTICRDQ